MGTIKSAGENGTNFPLSSDVVIERKARREKLRELKYCKQCACLRVHSRYFCALMSLMDLLRNTFLFVFCPENYGHVCTHYLTYPWKEKNILPKKKLFVFCCFRANEDEDWLCDTSRNYVCLLRVPLNRNRSLPTKMASRSFVPSMLYVSYERSIRSYLIWGCPAIINCLTWMTIDHKSNFIELRLVIEITSLHGIDFSDGTVHYGNQSFWQKFYLRFGKTQPMTFCIW